MLDGAVDPLTSDHQSFADQLQGFEGAFDQFAAWCDAAQPCAPASATRAQAVYAAGRGPRTSPIPSSQPSEHTRTRDRRARPHRRAVGAVLAVALGHARPALLDAAERRRGAGCSQLADQYNQRSSDGTTPTSTTPTPRSAATTRKPGPTDATIRSDRPSSGRRSTRCSARGRRSRCSAASSGSRTALPVPQPTARLRPRRCWSSATCTTRPRPYQGAMDLAKTMGNARAADLGRRGAHVLPAGQLLHRQATSNDYLIDGTLPPDGNDVPAVTGQRASALSVTPAEPARRARRRARAARRPGQQHRAGATAASSPCCACCRSRPRCAAPAAATGWPSPGCATGVRGWNGDQPLPRRRRRAGARRSWHAASRACRSRSSATRWADAPRCTQPGTTSVRAVVGLAPWIEAGDPVEQLAGPARAHRARRRATG